MNGVLLDPRTGKRFSEDFIDESGTFRYRDYLQSTLDRPIPDSIFEYIEKARKNPRGSGPTATKQGFYELLAVDLADGTQVLNSTTETIITPDYTFAAYDPHIYPGASFQIMQDFDVSNVVTTPGTITFRIRWGGVAGTILAATSAIAMSATLRANFSGSMLANMTWRTVGSAGSVFCMGTVNLNNVPAGADAAPQGQYTMGSAGANVPAVVSALDTTTAKALSVTVQFSVNTATTQLTNHLRYLICMN